MISPPESYSSVFDTLHDVVVFGGGWAGFAAAWSLHASGKRVLLVDRAAALLWESGWGFAPDAGDSDDPLWRQWMAELSARGAASGAMVDGAIAEVLATERMATLGLPALYYATPVAVESKGGLIDGVIVATKSGLRRLASRQWVDATEEGELLHLMAPQWHAASPTHREVNLFLRRAGGYDSSETGISCPALPGARLSWLPSVWQNERRLRIELPADGIKGRMAWLPALEAVRAALPAETADAVLTHGSVLPVGVYSGGAEAPDGVPGNVALAVPAASGKAAVTLADRFNLGLDAVGSLSGRDAAAVSEKRLRAFILPPSKLIDREAEVAVAGAGTGGALAALAAAREGRRVLAFDPLPFAGGIGSGGGIHWYYFGVKGGLQEEVDERIRQITPLFGTTPQVRGFHPEAKKIALESLMDEAGVELLTGATLWSVEKRDARVTHGYVSTPAGTLRVSADAWIDSTGDGDLAAQAGAAFTFGREGDGLFHAYSQSSGRAGVSDGKAAMQIINYDAGWVDPTSAEDLTRARIHGIRHYVQERFTEIERPTYIAPAIGLRQCRQIETDYQLSLADLVEGRTFTDAVGLTGCHYDNHAVDYEFESDEALFWVWACRAWSRRTASEIPYGVLLPKGLDNVWIACRALGVTADAHHSMRMQRDIQRIGEVAGLAASLAVSERTASREVPLGALQERLAASGALKRAKAETEQFGPQTPSESVDDLSSGTGLTPAHVTGWLADLEKSAPAEALWHLYRAGSAVEPEVRARLASPDPVVSWNAALLLAMWADSSAEARLIQAVEAREYGFDDAPEKERPENHIRVAPHWLIAAALLRRCGTALCLPALEKLAADPELPLNARPTIALTCARLAERNPLAPEDQDRVIAILERILATPAPVTAANPQRNILRESGQAAPSPTSRRPVIENFRWQLDLAAAQARLAVGLPLHAEAEALRTDERALVRRAFERLFAPAAGATPIPSEVRIVPERQKATQSAV